MMTNLIKWFSLGISLTVLIAMWPIEYILSPEWIVNVLDENGRPAAHIVVGHDWHYYSFNMNGGEDLKANEMGMVTFPRRSERRYLIYWVLLRLFISCVLWLTL